MKTAAKIAKNLFSAAASLGFSLMLAVYIILFALFMGAYELPVKLLLIGAIPLTLILDGQVTVNGEVCTMRGKKLRSGDKFSFMGSSFVITDAAE